MSKTKEVKTDAGATGCLYLLGAVIFAALFSWAGFVGGQLSAPDRVVEGPERIVKVPEPGPRVEIEVEKIVTVTVEKPVTIEKLVTVEKVVEKLVEKRVPVDRVVYVDRPVEIERVVERLVYVPVVPCRRR